ncbi:low-density lipoprotein receptor-related protein 2-like isoform X3 [Oncorhynchus mykiss]|uniref:low-density lipoprotein receptor-related protein 2-like isoform X3 n=1 Tax=Oncorhynchus mykiss TaxID=8022 RepID=UPI0018785577|nr:low-density lipoprotein receptor-related protein 2-like isoform X3 [Oncorhynchus mykiss]
MELLQFTCLLLLISLKCLTGFGQQCGGNQWQCDDGACLRLSWHCDGNGDCMDGSDEMACPCPRGQVACMAGAPGCVSTSAVCDGQRQCSDGSDEFNCPENQGCLQGDWRCRNKICIPKDLYCNGANDCVDNSDEACGRCGPMAVRCPGGECLTEDERCDGKLHCSDGSDEPSTCGRTCSEENGGCSHSCVDQPWGALCSCPKGHRLSANGASCLDVDECALAYGPCMHFCVNTPGSFYCHCRDGFQLQGTTYCYAKENYTKFLTAKNGTIGFLNLKTLRFESIQSTGYDPLALAFDLSRSSFYWADNQGNIYKAKEKQRRILYHGQYGVRSLVCDWLTGQLYWTNQKTRSIHVGAADGSGFATVLAKNIDPLELVLLPIESLLFWINKGPGDKITLERSGMDGIKQESLVVLTAQAPRSLTLDVTARRLYWMSHFKKSIETVRVDGSGRYSFLEFFKRRPAQSLAVIERWFYWTDQKGLWRSPQDRPNQKTFIQRTTLPVLEAYHEQQQPKAPSACVKSGCQLCMLTLDLPAGFTCTCPDDKLLMADGSCEYPRFAYATSTTLNLFELKGKELIKTKLLTTDDVMESFDIDWRGDWVYWANSTGHVMRWSLNTGQTETVPTLKPACVVSVDQKMRNLYWLSCDEACVGVTNMDQGYPRRLYQSGSEVRDVYLDWQRGRLYLLEAGWILSMRLPGGNPRKVLRVEGHVAGRIVLDLQSNTLLWKTEGDDLKIMSLLKSQTHLVGREWNVPGSIMAAHSPLLVSLFNDVITVWDRRDRRRVHDVPVGPGIVRVIVALDVKEVPPAQPVCISPSVRCRGSTLCISQTQLCDTLRDCPDGFDEESCITKCPNRGEFRCKDRRKCIERSLVCDGRAHCHDGSDEIGCPTIAAPTSQTAPLKCRMGSRLCKDGRECVLHSHVCDGEVDCTDGSDEQDCGESPVPLTTAYLAPTTTVPDILPAQPVCTSPSVRCRGSTLCISQTQLCDTLRDCPDGFDEESCITKCPNRGEFRCKDRRKCIERSLVCDGRAHCHDGSDEIGCPTIAAPTSQTAPLKCRMGSRLCKDGRECVLHSHVCDGEVDCTDGSDEQDCGDILPAQPVCTSPSVRCRGSTLCISQTQLCDTLRDCPDGFDEESCITKCPNRGEFRCKDRRKCIERSLVCDGRAHCHDGSDEIGCPTIAAPTSQTAPLKCRMGSRLCKDGRECVLHSHVCDGEVDCTDGSDEQDCGESPVPLTTAYLAPTTTVPDILPAQPVCTSPSVRCRGSTLCISQTQLCDTLRDCPDGFDEESCITKCPNRGEFRCKDRRKCIERSLVCDGRAHCHDGSDEIGCPTIAAPTSQTAPLKCRMGSRLCKDGRECVLHSHVCDGEVDCTDGSDEQDCGESPVPLTTAYLAPTTTVPDILPAQPVCTSPSVRCRGSTLCISQTQLCDTLRDCPDGFDEESCITKCPNRGEFRCKDRRKCIERSLVCDGRAHCHDGSDEIGCPTIAAPTSQTAPLKCRMGSRLCKDGRECVLHSHVCDGEVDCTDGSDEQDCELLCKAGQFQCAHGKKCIDQQQMCDGKAQCQDRSDEMDCFKATKSCSHRCDNNSRCIPETFLCDGERDCADDSDEEGCDSNKVLPPVLPTLAQTCTSPSVRCRGSTLCISQTQLCDTLRDCPDGFDEESCITKCPNRGEFRCKDRRKCIERSLVCDGRAHCHDGSDEIGCPTIAAPTSQTAPLKCRMGSRLCKDGRECVLHSHVCDGEVDCTDGSDEQDCELLCKAGQFQCAHGKKCIDQQQMCDGKAQCQDRSDEMDCFKATKSCSHRCDNNSRCIPEIFLCDGERDCADDSDEEGCDSNKVLPPVLPTLAQTCTSPSVRCRGSTLCISQTQLCDTLRDCPDGFDEESCITKCPNRGEFRCKDRRKCIERSLVCDGRAHCHDGSDEIGCPTIAAPTSQTAPLKCRMGSRLCKDGRECVLHSHVCDGEVDCKDGSDEQDCELLCKPGQFQCAHGKKCIDQQQMCDGKAQCQDRSDEMDCFKATKSCSHRCDNNSRCIPETFLCDGERDCSDGSDEEDCVAKLCGQQQYHCSNGQCVSEALRCDGHADCGDHSDEVGCAKPPHCPPERRCPNSHECLVEEWLCDGEQDCQDGSDEMNCKVSPVTCGEFQWSCVSKTQCIPATWRCDGQQDCEDYSDEAGCDQLKCSNQLYQCGSGECVDHSLLCDHIINCPDGSDEGHGCSTNNCSSPGTPQCDQHCVSTPYGPRCICAAGFRLQANGLSCVDVDECNEVLPPVCSHTCLNTRSSFLCRCHHGYLLEPNGHSCKTQDEAHLLASVQNELLVLGLHSSSLSLLSTSQTPVFCVDYDWRDQRVYWVSLEEESIKWTSINTKDTGTLVKGVKSESIAVDWVGRNLYWLDGLASQILAVRLGTSTVKSQNYIVVLDEDLEQPRSLLLLPHKGLMYWSEVGSDPQIERSGMDGSERKVVLTRGLSWPVSLSVDTLTDRIYWADEKLQCIGSVSLEGHNVRLLQLTEMPSPFSVMVFNDMVYWSDTRRRTIQVSHKNTGKNRKVLLKRPGQPFGIRIMHPLRQTNVSSPCEKLQCSHICLLAPGLSTGPRAGSTGPKAVCRCAAGLLLAGDGLTCSTLVDTTFLLLLSPTAVTQIYLSTIHNGVGLKRLPEHHIWSLPWTHQASGLDLAVQERNLYLADAAQGSVDLLKLSSSGLTPDSRVLNLQDDTVMALAVDWVTLNLYWSSRKQPDLHVTTTRGQHTAPLLQLGLQGTTSIALHPPSGRLCFTALGQVNVRSLPQVDCAFMDGRSQKLLWRKAVMPTSLLFSNKGTRLYWADIGAGVIDSILLDGSGYKQFKADPGLMSFTLAENVLLWSSLDKDVTRIWFSDGFQPKQLFEVNTNVVALRVYSKTSQKGTNSCSERNGGCSQLCLAYPGGRSCRCGRGYQPVDTNTCSPFPSLQCPEGSRACSDGSRCLPLTKFCNHQTDCLDHSDEIKCWSGVKPQDVSHSKPSPGHAGNTVPPSQDWSGRTTPGGVEVQKLESCDAQQCNGHGKCVARGGETTCQCVLGYHGVFCEEGEGPGVSNAPLTLGILSLIGGVLIAAVIIWKSRARAAARGQSTDKETLMTNKDEQTVYAVSFNNDLYDPDQELISSADGTSQHL